MLNQIIRVTLIAIMAMVPMAGAAVNVTGTTIDREGEPLISASVRLLAARDSALVKTAITDVDGGFKLTNVHKGKYIVELSYVGYENTYKDVTVGENNVPLGKITLQESSVALREAVVRGVRTPIKVMQDTVEFAADAYKTAPNAVVEDLLKRLPGVEVSSDGKITANGKEVSKILVDGKEFFSDDPTVASRNLPVEMVEKLQVVDRKSDLARMTGVDDGEEETVINLTVKKGMKNGWFGNVEAGYGTDDRYKGSFVINRFIDENQITFLGGLNNINEPAFIDAASGRFRRFGGMNGITSAQSLGVNFNVGNGEILRVGGDVMWSRSDRDTEQRSDRQNIFSDYTTYINSQKKARDIGNSFRGDFRVMWKPDSANTLEFRPNFSYTHSHSWSADSSLTRDVNPVTKSINRNSARGDSYEFTGRLIYNHLFMNHRGRSFSVFANYRMSNVREYENTYSWNKFFQLGDSVDLYDQYEDNHTWSNSVAARATWTEPLGDPSKGNFLTLAYRFSYRWNNADKFTYDHPVFFPDGFDGIPVIDDEMVRVDSLSNQFRNDYMNQDIRIGYKHVSKKDNLEVGLSLVPQMSKSIDLINDNRSIPRRDVLNVAPFLRYRYRASNTRSFNANYRGRSSQPSMTQLQPVADYSDPLNVVQGNPELKPSFTHNLSLRFQDFNPDAQRSIMMMGDASVVQNSIISHTTYDKTTGGRYTTYENVNGVWNVRLMTMVSLPLRNRQFSINNHLMGMYDNSIGYSQVGGQEAMRNRSGSLRLMESLGFAWRPDNANFEIRPLYNLQYVTNSVQRTANRTVHSYGGRFDGTYYTPFGLVISTDLTYSATSGYSQGYDTRQWMWNASLSYMFLRNKAATVTVKGYDLLGQRSNVMRNVTANYIDDVRYNSLTRYFMVSLTYKFNTFGSGNEPERRNDMMRGFGPPPGGGPGGPGGPGGRRH